MTKTRNKRFYGDIETLERLAEEIEFIGREFYLDRKNSILTVFALPRRHKKSPKVKEKKEARNKRAESAGRRNNG